MTTTSTTAKVEARILSELATSRTFREGVTAAAWKAVQEATALGWTERQVAGVAAVFATVGAEILAAVVAEQATA